MGRVRTRHSAQTDSRIRQNGSTGHDFSGIAKKTDECGGPDDNFFHVWRIVVRRSCLLRLDMTPMSSFTLRPSTPEPKPVLTSSEIGAESNVDTQMTKMPMKLDKIRTSFESISPIFFIIRSCFINVKYSRRGKKTVSILYKTSQYCYWYRSSRVLTPFLEYK